VHLSESQLKQLGDLALRAASNSAMPFGGRQYWRGHECRGQYVLGVEGQKGDHSL
jgi:hypothetical protein